MGRRWLSKWKSASISILETPSARPEASSLNRARNSRAPDSALVAARLKGKEVNLHREDRGHEIAKGSYERREQFVIVHARFSSFGQPVKGTQDKEEE